jgi:hypothetical protein
MTVYIYIYIYIKVYCLLFVVYSTIYEVAWLFPVAARPLDMARNFPQRHLLHNHI